MNTLEISEKLKQAGVAEPQAKVITSAIQEGVHEAEEYADDAVEEGKKELAKQADIVSLKADIAKLDAKLEKMESRLESRLSQTTLHITRFSVGLAFGTLTVQTGLIAILLMLFLERT